MSMGLIVTPSHPYPLIVTFGALCQMTISQKVSVRASQSLILYIGLGTQEIDWHHNLGCWS